MIFGILPAGLDGTESHNIVSNRPINLPRPQSHGRASLSSVKMTDKQTLMPEMSRETRGFSCIFHKLDLILVLSPHFTRWLLYSHLGD